MRTSKNKLTSRNYDIKTTNTVNATKASRIFLAMRNSKTINQNERPVHVCGFFVMKNFKSELENQNDDLLWISADPGCGKSVLSRFLVDDELHSKGRSICYFFFKDNEQQDRLATAPLCMRWMSTGMGRLTRQVRAITRPARMMTSGMRAPIAESVYNLTRLFLSRANGICRTRCWRDVQNGRTGGGIVAMLLVKSSDFIQKLYRLSRFVSDMIQHHNAMTCQARETPTGNQEAE